MDADQSGHGEERLAGDPDTQRARGHRPGLHLLPPSPKMLAKIAVETARSPGVGRKCGERDGWIRAREMDAVVAKEDPVAVCRVGVTGQVRYRGRGDFHTPADTGVPCREALPENGRVRKTR